METGDALLSNGTTNLQAVRPITSSEPVTADPSPALHDDDDAESVESRPLALQRALREVEAAVDAEFVASMDRLEQLGRREEDLQGRLEELYLELGTVQDALVETSREAREAFV
jgi:hypothetical protein